MSGNNGGHNGARPKLTPEQVAELVERRNAGESWTPLAAHFGVTIAALIYRYNTATQGPAKKASYEATATTAPATDTDLAAILTTARHAQGVADLRDLLDALGLTPRRVAA